MRIVDALFFIIAGALASALLWISLPIEHLSPLLIALVVAADRWLGKRWPHWLLPALLFPLWTVWVTAASDSLSVDQRIPLVLAAAAVYIGWSVVGRARFQALFFAVAPLLVALIWLLGLSGSTESRVAAAYMGIMTMVCWPLLISWIHPRHWLIPAAIGPLFLLILVRVVVDHAQASPGTVSDVLLAAIPATAQNLTIYAQITLFLVVIVPLTLQTPLRWVLLALIGLGVFAGSFGLVAMLQAPELWGAEQRWLIALALAVFALGCAGILSANRRSGSLAMIGSRMLGLGCLACAVEFALLLAGPPEATHLVSKTALALAPLTVAVLLCMVVTLAYALPLPRGDHLRLRTDRVLRAWGQWRQQAQRQLRARAQRLAAGSARDFAHLRDPWRLLPLLIFAAAWPAINQLREGLGVLALYFIGYFIASWAALQPVLWLGIHLSVVLLACSFMGYGHDVMPLFGAIGLIAAWPFYRWPNLDASFAYPLTLLLMAPLWLHSGSVDPTQTVFAIGLVILLANALRRGPIRWFLLGGGSVVITVWISFWILERDPFTTIYLEGLALWPEIGHLLAAMPLMVLLLLVVWITRMRGGSWWHGLNNRELLAVLLGLTLLAVWVIGWRSMWWSGLLAMVSLIMLGPSFDRHLRLAQVTSYRHPLTTALAIILMLLLVAMSQALAYLPSREGVPPSQLRVSTAGVLGPLYVDTIRHISAVLLAVVLIIAWHLVRRHGSDIAIATTGTFRKKMPRPAGLAQRWRPMLARYAQRCVSLGARLGTPVYHLCLLIAARCRTFVPRSKGSDRT